MQYFNRTFFRFAFGFIGIIAISMLIIIFAGAAQSEEEGDCIFDCTVSEVGK